MHNKLHAIINGLRIEEHILAYVFVGDNGIRVQGEVIRQEEKHKFRDFLNNLKEGEAIEIDCEDAKGLKVKGAVKISKLETKEVRFGDKTLYAFYLSLQKF